MKIQSCKISKNLQLFIKNDRAVFGMPMRLTVSIIIGIAAMIMILTYILNPCLFPSKMVVSIDPLVNVIDSGDSKDFNITAHVTDKEGRPIIGALVIIKGLGDVGSANTNTAGNVNISIMATLQSGQNEGYLDISVKYSCFETFSQTSMIKVVRW